MIKKNARKRKIQEFKKKKSVEFMPHFFKKGIIAITYAYFTLVFIETQKTQFFNLNFFLNYFFEFIGTRKSDRYICS